MTMRRVGSIVVICPRVGTCRLSPLRKSRFHCPAFLGDNIETLDERVAIPTNIFKAIFIPARNTAGAYWTPNDGSQKQEHVSIALLTELIGIDVFPRAAAAVKQTAMVLPNGSPHFGCRLRTNN